MEAREEGEVEVRRRQDPRGLLASPRVLTCSLSPLSPKQSFVKCLSVRVGQLILQLQAAAIYGRFTEDLEAAPASACRLLRSLSPSFPPKATANGNRSYRGRKFNPPSVRPSFRLSPLPSYRAGGARSNSSTRLLSGGVHPRERAKEDKFYSFRARPRRPRICELRMPFPHR